MAHKKKYIRRPSLQKVYVFSIDGDLDTNCYSTLKGIAGATGIAQSSLSTGKRVFIREQEAIRIHELRVIRTKRKQK